MTQRVVLYTFGVFTQPSEHPVNDGFHALNDAVLDVMERSEGFIARSGYDGDPGPKSWGQETYPKFYQERGDGWSPATLSLWVDLASPMAATYFGLHARALAQGRKWFRKPKWPPYALWWVAESHVPDWREAVLQHSYLHTHGPTARVFNFKVPFDASGSTVAMDRKQVKAVAARNAEPGDCGRTG